MARFCKHGAGAVSQLCCSVCDCVLDVAAWSCCALPHWLPWGDPPTHVSPITFFCNEMSTEQKIVLDSRRCATCLFVSRVQRWQDVVGNHPLFNSAQSCGDLLFSGHTSFAVNGILLAKYAPLFLAFVRIRPCFVGNKKTGKLRHFLSGPKIASVFWLELSSTSQRLA